MVCFQSIVIRSVRCIGWDGKADSFFRFNVEFAISTDR